jgi:hypothetical protein
MVVLAARRATLLKQVAIAIVELFDHPRPEIYTLPGQAETIARYYADVAGSDENIGR